MALENNDRNFQLPQSAKKVAEENSIVQQKNSKPDDEALRPAVEMPQDFITHFDAFNWELFGGTLSDCIGVYTRKGRTLGYYAPDRLERNSGEKCAEIALNPIYLARLHPICSASVLVHEMAHHWRRTQGSANKKGARGTTGYHCSVWGTKMKEIGLYPSNTGMPGGAETGQQIMHYIIEGGPFDKLATDMFNRGLRFHWHDAVSAAPAEEFDRNQPFVIEPREPPADSLKKKTKTRVKFSCSQKGCGLNSWAKPSAKLRCDRHNFLMVSTDAQSPKCAPVYRKIADRVGDELVVAAVE